MTHSGSVYCWGAGDDGQREQDAPANCATQPAAEVLQNIENVSVGDQFICTRSRAGEVACWGRNQEIQLGSTIDDQCVDGSSSICSRIPRTIEIPESTKTLATGKAACAQDSGNQKIRCWGPGHNLSLPNNVQGTEITDRGFLPGLLRGSGAVAHVALGESHGCLVDAASDTLRCWGEESVVWAGDSLQSIASTPTSVPMTDRVRLLEILELTVGHRHTCTLRQDRVVRCWGYMMGDAGRGLALERSNGLYGELP